MCARIDLIALYASSQRGGAGWGVSRDCGIGFSFFRDLDTTRALVSSVGSASFLSAVRDVLHKLVEGISWSEHSERLELASSLIRFDGFGLGDCNVDARSALVVSYRVTAPWYGLVCAESLVTALDTWRRVEGIATIKLQTEFVEEHTSLPGKLRTE